MTNLGPEFFCSTIQAILKVREPEGLRSAEIKSKVEQMHEAFYNIPYGISKLSEEEKVAVTRAYLSSDPFQAIKKVIEIEMASGIDIEKDDHIGKLYMTLVHSLFAGTYVSHQGEAQKVKEYFLNGGGIKLALRELQYFQKYDEGNKYVDEIIEVYCGLLASVYNKPALKEKFGEELREHDFYEIFRHYTTR